MNPDCVNDSSGVVARYSLRQNCCDRPDQTVDILDPTSFTHKSDSPDAPRERPESSADLYTELVEQASARGRVLHAFREPNRIQLRQPVLLVENEADAQPPARQLILGEDARFALSAKAHIPALRAHSSWWSPMAAVTPAGVRSFRMRCLEYSHILNTCILGFSHQEVACCDPWHGPFVRRCTDLEEHMFAFGAGADAKAILDAMSKSQAIIEFKLDGTIITANENFCRALGYQLGEIVDKHHRMFVDPTEAATADYRNFWARLACGEYDRRQYKRISKDGTEIWIEASYNPIFRGGKPYKVVKFATDITTQKRRAAEDSGKLSAISRAQAVIEFTPKGDILTANENFLTTMGYQLSEIQGKHHSIFCEPSYTNTKTYRQFWDKLAGGEFVSDEFMRLGKGGKRVFIQATYNPIFDMNGNIFKVVKFATDITARVGNVDQLAGALNALAEGDLTQSIAVPFLPALDKLRVDFNGASSKLRSTLQTISENAGAIASASQQIQSASNDLSKRTEQQAASVEETAAALEEITTTVSDSSHRAQEAGKLVRRTKENAEHSGNVVGQAVEAMGKIEKSASEIANIIGVIDEIAFQTNLLALNAGVEAARAGEAGKGFAVVAQEVRELAQRSAKAAKEIKELINASNEHVKSGVALVGNTGKALQEMVTQVMQVDGNVEAIVVASKEQATGLKEINTAVNTIDQGTQQNAAMVEETSAAACSLAREAEKLFELLGQFDVGTGAGAYRTAPTAVKEQSRPVASAGGRMTAMVA